MSTLYFNWNDEICYPLAYHIDEAKENGLNQIKLFKARKVDTLGYFFCKAYLEIGDVGQCGRSCAKYAPQNGRSGKCKHRGFTYENTGIEVIIDVKEPFDSNLRQVIIESYFSNPRQTIRVTADIFNLSYNQVKNFIYQSGRRKVKFNPRKVLPEKRKEIFDYWYANPDQTQSVIAVKFNVSPVTVHHIINEFSKFRNV
jgi:hypothetical protein